MHQAYAHLVSGQHLFQHGLRQRGGDLAGLLRLRRHRLGHLTQHLRGLAVLAFAAPCGFALTSQPGL